MYSHFKICYTSVSKLEHGNSAQQEDSTEEGKFKNEKQRDGTRDQNTEAHKMRLEQSSALPNPQASAASNISHLALVYNTNY